MTNWPLDRVDPSGLDSENFFTDAFSAQNREIDISFDAWNDYTNRQTFGVKYYSLPGHSKNIEEGLGVYYSSIYGTNGVRMGGKGWQTYIPYPTWTDDNWVIHTGNGQWITVGAAALYPGMNGAAQAAASAAKNFMKLVKPDNINLRPGDWEPPVDLEDYLSEASRSIKDALDKMDWEGSGILMISIDHNIMGCAGYPGISCDLPEYGGPARP